MGITHNVYCIPVSHPAPAFAFQPREEHDGRTSPILNSRFKLIG